MDPFAQFKEFAKQSWSNFAAAEMTTGSVAPRLVEFAAIRPGARVLDVACGTGVVALTAARLGAVVTGIDLTPALVARAKENAAIMGLTVDFREADAEELPFPDATFDFVVSQFGHMFAPRPDVVVREMLRVLEPGGTIAFSTWPKELLVGKIFATIAKYSPPPPPGIRSPADWGDPATIAERLGDAVRDLCYARDAMLHYTISIPHVRLFLEDHIGPLSKLVAVLRGSDDAKLAALRAELEAMALPYFHDNRIRNDFLMTRAVKR